MSIQDSSSTSQEINFDFEELIEENFPHKCGIPKDLINQNNNYFNASIHCLTSIRTLSKDLKDEKNIPYINLVNKLYTIPSNKNDIIEYIDELKKYIFETNKYNNKDADPRKLIGFILSDLKDNNISLDSICFKFEKICNICKKNFYYVDKDFINEFYIKFDIPQILKYSNERKNSKITIYDCFNYYFETLMNNQNALYCNVCEEKAIITLKNLPKNIFIFIDYGNNKNCNFENSAYEFDENFNFKNINFKFNNFIKDKDKYKEYFLSSLIVCKNIDTNFETFYTLSRGNEKSKYIIYNGNEVREKLNVINYIKKDKIDFTNQRESYPFILVYTCLEKNNI